ncbi:MAG: ComF family protein [Phycisphaerales bacterium]|nr:ComF family protein [Phycisphaerales bacterium]
MPPRPLHADTLLTRLADRALPIEQAILPHTDPPWREQVRQTGWQPDALGSYCDRCGAKVGPHELDDLGCSHCRGTRPPWNQIVRLAPYEEPMLDWIHAVKFTRWGTLGRQLGQALGGSLIEAGLDPSRTIITPMPTTWRRRIARGIDHAAEIAQGLAGGINAPMIRLLTRDHRPSQRAVAPSARKHNVAQAFHLKAPLNLRGWDLVVVDDVCTTGATLKAACRAARALHPDMLWAAVLAVSDDHARRARRADPALRRHRPTPEPHPDTP